MATALEQYRAIEKIVRDDLHMPTCFCQVEDNGSWDWFPSFQDKLAKAGVDPVIVFQALGKMSGYDAEELLKRAKAGKAGGHPCVSTSQFLTAVVEILEPK